MLAVVQVELLHTGKFNAELLNLFQRQLGESALGFASEDLADEQREFAAVWEHGPMHDLDCQTMAKLPTRDQAIAVVAGTVAPLQEGLVLGRRRAVTINVAIGAHAHDFGIRGRTLNPSVFVTAAEDVSLESHVRDYPVGDLMNSIKIFQDIQHGAAGWSGLTASQMGTTDAVVKLDFDEKFAGRVVTQAMLKVIGVNFAKSATVDRLTPPRR